MLHCRAALFRFLQLFIIPLWQQRSEWYTWKRHIQIAASGENGMQQHFIFLQIFSAPHMFVCFSLSMMITLFACSLSEYTPVCTSCSRFSKRCCMMLDWRLSMYDLLHPGRRLLRWWPAGWMILTGLTPTNDLIGTFRMKAWWLPTPYPNGITHELLMSRSLDIHKPSIGLETWKNVAPGLVPVCWTIASCRSNHSLSTRALTRAPLITCLLWSMKRIILSPSACHCLICFTRCLQNKLKGQVRSFFFMMKYLHCCWYVIPKFTLLSLHGLYTVIMHVLRPFIPPRRIQLHLPRPSLSCPVFYVPTRFTKADSACASFLYPSCKFGFLNTMCRYGRTCQFTLEHLFQIILIIFVPEVDAVLAVHEVVDVKVLFYVKCFCDLCVPPNSAIEAVKVSPILQNIPCCFILGAVPCTCNSPSSTALSTLLCLSLDPVAALPFSSPSLKPVVCFYLADDLL